MNQTTNSTTNYLYNGNELQNFTNYYAYGFRQQDPQLGRWHSIDKLAENYLSQSPYSYAGNNPINNIDVLGLMPDTDIPHIGGIVGVAYEEAANGNNSLLKQLSGSSIFNDPQANWKSYINAQKNGFVGSYLEYVDAINGKGFSNIGGYVVSNSSLTRISLKTGVYVNRKRDRKILLSIFLETFGTNEGFYFKKKKLMFDENSKEKYDNLDNDNATSLFNAIYEAITTEGKFVSVYFQKSYLKKEFGATEYHSVRLDGPLRNGGAYVPSNNAIYVWPERELSNRYGTFYRNQLFWHELGHFLTPNIPGNAIILENYMRAINGIEDPRDFDDKHPEP